MNNYSKTLSYLRSAAPDVFGADIHDFELNPTLPETEVCAFEGHYGITLPDSYRKFLTEVGNGGAGPFYGVFPLGYADDNFDLYLWREQDGMVGDLSEPFPHTDAWNDLTGKPEDDPTDLIAQIGPEENEYDRQMEAFTKVYWGHALINGAIPICHQGCALRIYLVVTGPQAGYLWDDRRAELTGIRPVRLADGSAATFASWYEHWLRECLVATSGHP